MSNKGVCRTAPATPVLLMNVTYEEIISMKINYYMKIVKNSVKEGSFKYLLKTSQEWQNAARRTLHW